MPTNGDESLIGGYRTRFGDVLLDELLGQLSAVMVVGPRAAGKTTTTGRRAASIVRLDREAEAAAFKADPDAALGGLPEPVLLDEWQVVPGSLGAVRRAVEASPAPGRFMVTGSVRAEMDHSLWPGTGRVQRVTLYPMTVREQRGMVEGATFVDKLAEGESLAVPENPPDLRGYVELALQGGFPAAALRLEGNPRQTWYESYLDDLLTYDVEALSATTGRRRDRQRLRSYLEAYGLNSAGIVNETTLTQAAGVNKETGVAYEQLLLDLFVADSVPAWTSNRLKRLVMRPKRYLVDPALLGAILRLDAAAVLADGNILGRLLDTLVAAQLRPELALSPRRPRLHHLRTKQGRQEVDLLIELAGDRVVGIEVKADAAPDKKSAAHLTWLRDQLGDRFISGVVLHTGPRVFELDDRILAAPIAALWAT